MNIKAEKYIEMGRTETVYGDLTSTMLAGGIFRWVAIFGGLEISGLTLVDLVSQLNNSGYLEVCPVST